MLHWHRKIQITHIQKTVLILLMVSRTAILGNFFLSDPLTFKKFLQVFPTVGMYVFGIELEKTAIIFLCIIN
jgi:hypothetical protein